MAAPKSQNDRLLVACEIDAPLPKLDDVCLGKAAFSCGASRERLHENVTVISQFRDEDEETFAQRIMSRVARDLKQNVVFRGAIVATNHRVGGDIETSRRQLVHSLAAMLALRPNRGLWLQAPLQAKEAVRTHLLTLIESTARGAPNLAVNVVFPELPTDKLTKAPVKTAGLRVSV